MVNGVAVLVWVLIMVAGTAVSGLMGQVNKGLGGLLEVITVLTASITAAALKLAAQWEKGVVFRLGKYEETRGPGLFWIIPVIDTVRMVDTRVLTTDIPKQQVITKDNVPVSINGVLYFRVCKPEDAVIKVQDYAYAISQYAQTALRDIVGGMTLDELLTEREQIGKAIEAIVEKESEQWGLEVTGIRLQDIDMPEELKKMMSRQASAEREKRATITKAEGDKLAALNLSDAARTMLDSPGAMQLRTLQTIDGLGPTASNTVVLAVPVEIMEAVRHYNKFMQGSAPQRPATAETDSEVQQGS